MLSMNQVLAIAQSDEMVPQTLDGIYSPQFHDVIMWNWSHVKCSLVLPDQNLICNEFTYRISKLQPQPGVDFWVSSPMHHEVIGRWASRVVHDNYCLRRKSVFINFGCAMAIAEETGETEFLYTSRGNHSCLETAYLIHSADSFMHFFNTVFPNYSLKDYVENVVQMISRNYEGLLIPLAITFFLTENPARIYGAGWLDGKVLPPLLNGETDKVSKLSSGKLLGVTGKCCKRQLGKNCVFDALSSIYDVGKASIPFKTNAAKKRSDKRRAIRLRRAFLKWLSKNQLKEVEKPLGRHGFNSLSLNALEHWLKCDINVYSMHYRAAKRLSLPLNTLKNRVIRGRQLATRSYRTERSSAGTYGDTVNLLSNENHVFCILDIKKMSSKFICGLCSHAFSRESTFDLHRQSLRHGKCMGQQLRYSCNTLVSFDLPLKENMDRMVPGSEFKHDANFMVVLLDETVTKTIKIELIVKYSEGKISKACYTFENIELCCRFVQNYCHVAAEAILGRRIKRNLRNLAFLQTALEGSWLESKDIRFCKDFKKLKYNRLLAIKSSLASHLEYVNCLIVTTPQKMPLAENFMMTQLAHLTERVQNSDIRLRYNRNKLSIISGPGERIRYNCINFSQPKLVFTELNEKGFDELNCLVKKFVADFSIDILSTTSTTDLGSKIISSMITEKQRLAMYSPSQKLYTELESIVKYGILQSKRIIVHPEAEEKTVMSFDFRRYYLSILGAAPPLLGHAVEYTKKWDGCFSSPRGRNRHSLANVVFSMLEKVTGTGFHFSLYGYEVRSAELRHDAIMIHDGISWAVEYDSCLFHCHFVDPSDTHFACHQPLSTITAAHKNLCAVCKNSEKTHQFPIPLLYRLKPGEDANSKHPVKKSFTHLQVKLQSDASFRKKMAAFGGRLYRVRDCEILHDLFLPVDVFCQRLGLRAKREFSMSTLHDCLIETGKSSFPFMAKPFMREGDVLDMIKDQSLIGFLKCSCVLGPQSRLRLGILKPFAFRESPNAAITYSYSVYNKIISTNILQFLLTCPSELPDVRVYDISSFYAYPTPRNNEHAMIFNSVREKIMRLLDKKTTTKAYADILKVALNGYIGRLAVNPSKFPKTFVISNDELLTVDQLKNFIKSENLTPLTSLYHFRGFPKTCNLSHWNVSIISYGIAELLRISLKLTKLTNLTVYRANVDGIQVSSCVQLRSTDLTSFLPSSLIHFTKPDLTTVDVDEFIDFIFRYFEKPGLCSNHVSHFKNCLSEKGIFEPEPCCKNYKNKNVGPFQLKLEFVGNIGFLKQTNCLSFRNTVTGAKLVKCSGSKFDDSLSHVLDNTSLFDLMSLARN